MPNEISKDELSYNEKVELFKELIFGKAANDDFEPKKRVSHKEKPVFPKEKLVVSTSKVEQSSSDFAVGDKGNASSTAHLILKAAEEVFLRDGFAAATTSAIAKSAGVMGLILMLICAMMTSISIVREKELGTMEVLLASPVPPAAIVGAKLMPYLLISIINLLTVLSLSTFLLGLPMAGSPAVFLGISLLYIFVCLLLGLLVSTVAATQLAAMLISLLLIVPSIYFSGLAFPIESMPTVLQYISGIVPARWFVEAARKLMIQGVAPGFVVRETLILALMAAALLALSLVKFKRRLE